MAENYDGHERMHSSFPSVDSGSSPKTARSALDAMSNEYKDKPNANLRMRELGSMRSRAAKEGYQED